MVHVLIDLRRSIVRHRLADVRPAGVRPADVRPAALFALLGLAVLSAVGTLSLGWVRYADPATATDVLALVSALWITGRLAQCAMSGEPSLHPEMFALLPLHRRRLGRALVIVGLLDPANGLLMVALAATFVHALRLGPIAAMTAVVAIALTVVMTSVLATTVSGLLGPGARRGHDAATIATAVLIGAVAVAGTLLPALVSALRDRSAGWLSDLVRALPSGWGPSAVEAAGRSDASGAVLPLAGLGVLTGVAVLVWPLVLGRRMQSRAPVRRARAPTHGRAWFAGSPTAAVVAKELRLWLRDPIRLTSLLIALVVGTATCVLPRVTAGTGLLLPFAGAMTVVIAGACACNLYGNDGSSVWLTVLTPGSAESDVRGRQLAWLIAVAPYAVAATVVLTAADGQARYWSWSLGLLGALLGGGAGVAAYGSLIAITPLDEAGNPTPAWSLKVHVALIAVALTALPPLLVLLAGWGWAAVPIGIVTGLVLGIWLGRRAIIRLDRLQVRMLTVLARSELR
jgi:ABC-2 type transport system permease protein